jgi:ribulose kinase
MSVYAIGLDYGTNSARAIVVDTADEKLPVPASMAIPTAAWG